MHNPFNPSSPNASHLGGGVLGRLDFRNQFYTEGSLRAGGLRNSFNGGDLGADAAFTSSTAYYGLHLGTGRVTRVSRWASLDLYGKYFWTHQPGDNVTLAGGDPVSFESVNSHRLRLGSRLTGDYAGVPATSPVPYIGVPATSLAPYIGAAWEHELDGKARATTHGFAIDAPSLSGSTGIGELGLLWKPRRNLSLDFGVQGYIGQREGCTASLGAGWVF